MIIIAGKNNIAVHGLELALRHFPADCIAVVCNKNDPGVDTWQRSLRQAAAQWGVKEISLDAAYEMAALAFISLEFDQLVLPSRFSIPAIFNIHFSKLPEYKGMFTCVWPILDGKEEAGVTLHYMDRGIDTGDIVDQQIFPIADWWTCRELFLTFTQQACELMDRWFLRLVNHQAEGRPQSARGSSYYSKSAIDYGCLSIKTNATAWECVKQIRAFAFREFQFLKWQGKPVTSATILAQKSCNKPGFVVAETEYYVDVATIDYDVRFHFDRLAQMLAACEQGDLQEVIRLEGNIAGYNDANIKGWTPLIVASYAGAYDVVNWLLKKGASARRPNNKGTTPLMYAKDAYFAGRCRRTFSLLLKNGADLQAQDHAGKKLSDYLSEEQYAELLVRV